jgi:hypothetical protein
MNLVSLLPDYLNPNYLTTFPPRIVPHCSSLIVPHLCTFIPVAIPGDRQLLSMNENTHFPDH